MEYILYFTSHNKFALVNKDDVLQLLYEQVARVPDKKYKNIRLYKYIKNEIVDIKKKINIDDIEKIKDNISKIDNKVPLYDIYSKKLYLIFRDNVYNRVIYKYYRFPDKQFYKQTEDNKILSFLDNFNINILEQTYVRVFYYYSNQVGKNITLCIRPSFLSHLYYINPYYTRSELINIGLNMRIIEPDNTYYDKDNKLIELCKKVQENDISKKVILGHQKYIVDNNGIHKVIYYSLHGSYFMNKYLRSGKKANKLIENNIISLWKLIKSAPAFNKPYWLYRFVDNDEYINYLKIGDVHTEKSFISTTRDPFYNNEKYKFGFILIKIKIPANKVGVALCMETFSNFKEEQEIIFPPLTRLKLVAKNKNCDYYHIDPSFKKNVVTKYEFEYEGNDNIYLEKRSIKVKDIYVDFNKLIKENTSKLKFKNKVNNFVNNYVNDNYQFQTTINDKLYTATVEWYDSTSAYESYYYIKSDNGFSIYIQNPDTLNMSLMMEIHQSGIHINHYSRFSYNDDYVSIRTVDSIKFISSIAYIFGIDTITIHSNYKSCTDFITDESSKTEDYKKRVLEMYNYREDFYMYMTEGYKRFDPKLEITAQFFYYELDSLKKKLVENIISRDDKDELYQIHMDNKNLKNIYDFYIYIIRNKADHIDKLEDKMERVFETNNPFIHDYYLLKPFEFLYNNKFISSIPIIEKEYGTIEKKYNKSSYRLDNYSVRKIYRR